MVKILTSGFPNGFPNEFSSLLKKYLKTSMRFVFVASEFDNIHEKTDLYCTKFLKMFSDCGINFETVNVVDGRVSKATAKDMIMDADVLWLAGGDTPKQFAYLEYYGLIQCIREHKGIIIGMSAVSINMSKTAVCTLTCQHNELKIYEALGLVEFSVEPHFDKDNITKELLVLSEKYPLYGICDDSAIICTEDNTFYIGDIFFINKGEITSV